MADLVLVRRYIHALSPQRITEEQQDMVARTGKGTHPWTEPEKAELLARGRVSGYQGHHINSVSANPQMAGDPNNIQFVRPEEHFFDLHNGDWRNSTWGPVIPR